jgi:hypothetical protein
MSKPSLPILTVFLVALAFAPVPLGAQGAPYADPQHRFTVQVPADWTSRDLADEGVMFYGPGVWLQVIPMAASGSLPEVIASLMDRINRSWTDLQEIDRRELTIMDQQTSWVIYNGTDFEGSPGTVRVMGVKGGGTTVGVIVGGERNRYNSQRGTFEAILATLRLGTNPPTAFATYPTSGGSHNAQPDSESAPADTASPEAGMGLEVRDVDDDDVRQFNLADDTGVVVEQVRQGGPADQAGIRENDVILQFDRTQVDGTEAFDRLLATHHPGDAVELLVGRNGRRRAVSVRLEVEP